MILGDTAVTALFKYLNENVERIGIEEKRIFKYEIPEKLAVCDYAWKQYRVIDGAAQVGRDREQSFKDLRAAFVWNAHQQGLG